MGVEVVADQDDALRLGEVAVDQIAHGVRPVDGRALGVDRHRAPPEVGRHPREEVGAAVAGVLRVEARRAAGGGRQRRRTSARSALRVSSKHTRGHRGSGGRA